MLLKCYYDVVTLKINYFMLNVLNTPLCWFLFCFLCGLQDFKFQYVNCKAFGASFLYWVDFTNIMIDYIDSFDWDWDQFWSEQCVMVGCLVDVSTKRYGFSCISTKHRMDSYSLNMYTVKYHLELQINPFFINKIFIWINLWPQDSL